MSMYPIATTYGGIEFFSNVPQNFDHLRIIATPRGITNAATDPFYIRLNEDFTFSYNSRSMQANGSSISYFARPTTDINFMSYGIVPASTAPANCFGVIIADIFDYSNTSKFTTVRVIGGHDVSGSGIISFGSGLYNKTNAITAVQCGAASQSATTTSRFDLYGIRSSE